MAVTLELLHLTPFGTVLFMFYVSAGIKANARMRKFFVLGPSPQILEY